MYIIAQAPSAAPITLSAGAATAAFNVIAGEPGAGTQVNLNAPGSNKLNGQPFRIRAAGNITLLAGTYTSAATPLLVAIYASNTASFAAATANGVFSSTAIPIFTQSSAVATSIQWEVEGQLQGDNVGARLMGGYTASYMTPAGVSVNQTIANGAGNPSSVNFAAEPPVQFAIAVVTAASNLVGGGTGGGIASLTSFVLEA